MCRPSDFAVPTRFSVLFSMLFSLLFAGCVGGGMVRVPKSDPTPPAATLEVQGSSRPLKLAVGGEPAAVELGGSDSLVLTGTAEDGDGLKDMLFKGNALVTCVDPGTGETFTRSTGFLRRHVPGGAKGARAAVRRDSRFVLRAGDLARLCKGGNLQGAVGQAGVQAANFHGGAASTPRLEFRVALSEVAAQAIPLPAAAPAVPGEATGFAPEPGLGGSGEPSAVPASRSCPRSAAPGRARESRSSPGECFDPPVPSLSPPSEAPAKASPAAARAGAIGPKAAKAAKAKAQRTKIRRI